MKIFATFEGGDMSILISCLYVLMDTVHKTIKPYLIRVIEIICVLSQDDFVWYRPKWHVCHCKSYTISRGHDNKYIKFYVYYCSISLTLPVDPRLF